jgi:hypothetical protein
VLTSRVPWLSIPVSIAAATLITLVLVSRSPRLEVVTTIDFNVSPPQLLGDSTTSVPTERVPRSATRAVIQVSGIPQDLLPINVTVVTDAGDLITSDLVTLHDPDEFGTVAMVMDPVPAAARYALIAVREEEQYLWGYIEIEE